MAMSVPAVSSMQIHPGSPSAENGRADQIEATIAARPRARVSHHAASATNKRVPMPTASAAPNVPAPESDPHRRRGMRPNPNEEATKRCTVRGITQRRLDGCTTMRRRSRADGRNFGAVEPRHGLPGGSGGTPLGLSHYPRLPCDPKTSLHTRHCLIRSSIPTAVASPSWCRG